MSTVGDVNRRVAVVAYDGLCVFEFGVASELFGLPRPELGIDDWYDYSVVSVDEGPVHTLGGVTMTAPNDLALVEDAGTVVVPGWRDIGEAPPAALLDALVVAHGRGARLMSICSGVFVLAATGLLDGRAATTHWRYTDRLAERFPSIEVRPGQLYVDEGTVLTSAGSAAGLDLGLHLIARDFGQHVANRVARRLVVPPHRDGGQAQFIDMPVGPASGSLAATTDWMLEHLGDDLPISTLAAHAHMSQRTFARRFQRETGTSPHRWLSHQRVLRAQHLLESTDLSIEQIATQCGFGSPATLRHHFERSTQTTPTSYRARFATESATARR